ncbi:MAG: hypothetical protein AAF226_10075 [Verrucomicrobiota bacterium]
MKGPKTAFHFVDDSTFVIESNLEEGLLVNWYQYWMTETGIIRYPLGSSARSLFDGGEEKTIIHNTDHILIDGFFMLPLTGRDVPPRCDFLPGSKPDEHGTIVPHTFKSKLGEPLDKPPGT